MNLSLRPCLLFVSLLFAAGASAQTHFILQGKVEYERRTNMYRRLEDNNQWREDLKKIMPEYRVNYFDLLFNNNKSLYQPGREGDDARKFQGAIVADDNAVFIDFAQNRITSRKNVFEQSFLLLDSLPPIRWKITTDMRKIAGFDCRKAVAKILDSVYVIAFYTDEVLVSGGPEDFHGLPGLILGLAIPRLHSTWYATKLELQEVPDASLKPPSKGKKTTAAELRPLLLRTMKDWGKDGPLDFWLIML